MLLTNPPFLFLLTIVIASDYDALWWYDGNLLVLLVHLLLFSFPQTSSSRILHLLRAQFKCQEMMGKLAFPHFGVLNYQEKDRTQENYFPNRTHFSLKQILQKIWILVSWESPLLPPFSIFLGQHSPSLLYFP